MPLDHSPVVIDNFMGFWKRGDPETCPLDHFQNCNNIQFLTARGFRTRDGIDELPIGPSEVARIYTYIKQGSESLLILDTSGHLYDTGSPTPSVPILSISAMVDFGFQAWAGYAYITPNDGFVGLLNDFVYVYKGDGIVTTARKAAGFGPTAAPTAAAGAAGHVEKGYHVFAVVFETDTGFLTKMGPGVALNAPGGTKINIGSVQVSPSSAVIARHVVATKAIDPTIFDGNLTGYQFFFVAGGKINDNTTTSVVLDFYDEDLLEDASYLLDILEEIPAGAGLTLYHSRMVQYAEHLNRSVARFSNPGEPESFDAVTGLVVVPLDSTPLQNGQEYRDVFYAFKQTKTYSIIDNGGDPTSWPVVAIDNGMGAPLHGVCTILDSDGTNIDFLIIANLSGLFVFNGLFQRPELSYKIKDYWDPFFTTAALILKSNLIQLVDDTLTMSIYIVMPDGTMLLADHKQGLDAKNIRWSPWSHDIFISAIAVLNRVTIALGSHTV